MTAGAVGLTYTRGSTTDGTIEANSPPRATGQWGATHTSVGIRKASLHRVRFPVSGSITATTGAVMVYVDPDRDYDDVANEAFGFLWHWRQDDNNRLALFFDDATGNMKLENWVSGSSDNVTVASTHAAGDPLAVYAAWDASNIYISINGGTLQSATRSQGVPTITTTTVDIGSDFGVQFYLDGAYAGVMHFSAPLTQAQVTALAAFRNDRPPLLGEVVEGTMAALWYGAHSVVRYLGTNAGALDLNDGSTTKLLRPGVMGAGLPVPNIRSVRTPLTDGARYIDTLFGPRVMRLPLLLTPASEWDARGTIASVLNPRRGQGLLYYAPSSIVYEIDAINQGNLTFDERAVPGSYIVSPAFMSLDPFWRVGTRQETSITVALGGWTIPWDITWEITASTGTATNDSALNNTGDTKIRPQVIFTAGSSGCSGPAITNDTSGATFDLNSLTLAADDTVTIDMQERTAVRGSDGANVMGFRTAASSTWELEYGQNTVTASVDSGSATVVVAYYPREAGV